MKNLKELKEELLKDERFKKEYSRYDLAFEIGEMVIDARVKLGITQDGLARKTKTQQPSIARLENGSTLPSLSFLEKIARGLGTYLLAPKFAFLENETSVISTTEALYPFSASRYQFTSQSWFVSGSSSNLPAIPEEKLVVADIGSLINEKIYA